MIDGSGERKLDFNMVNTIHTIFECGVGVVTTNIIANLMTKNFPLIIVKRTNSRSCVQGGKVLPFLPSCTLVVHVLSLANSAAV